MKLTPELKAKLEAKANYNYDGSPRVVRAYIEGAEAALALVPDAGELVSVIEGFIKLLDDQVLVRNIDDDHDTMKYITQGMRITGHLSATNSALAKYRAGG